jgi:hypothetical protein
MQWRFAADGTKFFHKIVFKQNYFPGQLDIIADSLMAVNAEFQAAHAATNYGYQFKNMNIAESVELDDPRRYRYRNAPGHCGSIELDSRSEP